ncbi:penicillin-binding transpeptidase domain-containing protein [Massiliimalia massiliensis]|uniref:penicillin-binding transpeptidase domain-containing protein n=1 Tax=Massiliimalia massiliensis TaxID=1852384 RepID=UPI0009844780|nr:penicillin-binding transpeptidase domain-containing protein [Massiliimalia massiliensis]
MAKIKQANQPMTNKMKFRLNRVVALIMAVVLLYVSTRLVEAAVVKSDFYQEYAAKQQMSTQVINANRGSIYSTNMTTLAQSATVWTVVLAPSIVKNDKVYVEIAAIEDGQKEALASSLSGILDMDKAKIMKRLESDQRFVSIKGSLKDSEVEQIKAFSENGNSCVMLAKEAVAKGLSDILELDYEDVLEQAYQNNQYEVIKKKVEKTVADEVRTLISENGFTFISLIEDTKRYYPNNELASNVLGFTGTDNQGLYGVELEYDSILQGTNGKIISATDGLGNTIPTSYEQKYDAVDGNSIVLTIDENIQRFAEKQVEEIMTLHEPEGGALIIVMDVKTGGILAMANSSNYDPNNPSEIFSEQLKSTLESSSEGKSEDEIADIKSQLRSEQWGNKAIGWLYEPGSTFKVVTASAALETGVATMSSTYHCSGVLNVAGTKIHCNKRTGHGTLDFKGAIVESCNPAFMAMGAALGPHNFFDFFEKFGLTEGTGIDLPGEAQKSLYYTEDKLGPVELASASFGQTSAISPIQLITAVSAAVNGGYLMQPHVLKEVLDQNGNVIQTTSTDVKRQVISEDTSAKIRECLEAMIQKNKTAYVKGYRIGGKSGTSQKANKSEEHVSSFVGFAPVEDPQIAVLVVADNPTAGSYYGSAVCGPALGSVIKDTLSYLGVAPEYSDEDLENMEVSVPSVIGSTVADAKNTLAKKSLKIKKVGDGDTVVDQMPRNGSIADGGTVIVYTEKNSTAEKVTVPNVVGMTPSAANQELVNAGLNVSLDGSSDVSGNVKVISQSVAEGKEVPIGTIVTIQYAVEVVD